jgi:SAM-dependent methyltransferase
MTKQAEREYALKADQAFLFTKPYNDPRTLREYALVLEIFMQHLQRGSRILDLGCGPGWSSLMLARAGFDVVGADISERMIEVAQERAEREAVAAEFAVADMEELDLEQRDFDAVLLFDCLHHCPGYEKVLRRAHEHLRPGGLILLFETTLLHRYSHHAREATRVYGVTELGFSRRQLRRGLRQVGFTQLKQFHDPGTCFRGLPGFLWANLRLWFSYGWYFPQSKNIFLARK